MPEQPIVSKLVVPETLVVLKNLLLCKKLITLFRSIKYFLHYFTIIEYFLKYTFMFLDFGIICNNTHKKLKNFINKCNF